MLPILLNACAVYLAMEGEQAPDISNVRSGVHKDDIEMHLNPPIRVFTNSEGNTVSIYKYKVGDEPSVGRAAAHAVIDFLTFLIWELVGTPIELMYGDTYELTIVYDKHDIAKSVKSRKIG